MVSQNSESRFVWLKFRGFDTGALKPQASNQPTMNRPSRKQPTMNRPSTNRPNMNRPSTNRPTMNRPSTNRPTMNRPSTNQPTINLPEDNVSYNKIPIIPNLPGGLEEFCGPPPTLPGLPRTRASSALRELSYVNWINHLRSDTDMRDESRIFEWDANGTLVGFGNGGRQIFGEIAKYLRQLHKASMFSGDLVNDVIIVLPRNTVSFRYLPLRGKEEREEEKGKGKKEEEEHDISTVEGIIHDLLHFRYLVAMLMNRLLRRNRRQRDLVPLPIDFSFFFSQVFPSMSTTNVQAASEFQLLHPLFFNRQDQIGFWRLVANYRKSRVGSFDKYWNTDCKKYGLSNWAARVPPNSPYSEILEKARDNWTKMKQFHVEDLDIIVIPMYLRNVVEHYTDHANRGGFDQSYVELLNSQLPGICSILLDAIIRGPDLATEEDQISFFTMHCTSFPLEPYRPIPLPADGDAEIDDGDYDDTRPSAPSTSRERASAWGKPAWSS